MEIKITTTQVLKVLEVLSWIIFIGLCIEAGAIIVNTIISLFINPASVKNFWEGSSFLSDLYLFDKGHFAVLTIIMVIVALLKAIMFYMIVQLFMKKKIRISQPFSIDLRKFMVLQSYLAVGIGFFSAYGSNYIEWLSKQGMELTNLEALNIAGADVWLFMAVILFVIVQVVKRGIEIQHENELTV